MNKMTIMAAVVLVAGCAETVTPRYDPLFGAALRDARMAMTIDPAAGTRIDQVKGIDGPAAKETVKRYQDSFKEPPPVTNVINIGGAIGSAAK
jgi:hypothetical protein